jgi:hypothetical protein
VGAFTQQARALEQSVSLALDRFWSNVCLTKTLFQLSFIDASASRQPASGGAARRLDPLSPTLIGPRRFAPVWASQGRRSRRIAGARSAILYVIK